MFPQNPYQQGYIDPTWIELSSKLLPAPIYYLIMTGLICFIYKYPQIKYKDLYLGISVLLFSMGTTHVTITLFIWAPDRYNTGLLYLLSTFFISITSSLFLWSTLTINFQKKQSYLQRCVNKEMKQHQKTKAEMALLKQGIEAKIKGRTQSLVDSNQRLQKEIQMHLKTQKLLHLKTQAFRRANKELEEFAYILSHDLRAPLRGINNFSELLIEQCTDLNSKARLYVGYIQRSTRQMNHLIHDLLEYARLNQIKPKLQKVDINHVLNEVIQSFSSEIRETGAELTYAHLPSLTIYPEHIRQVFQNLLSNALKFTDKKPHKIQIQATHKKNTWLFSVQDNGIGFRQQDQSRIFKIFQRLHNQNEFQGTGIGLASCKKIIEEYQGEIWAESTPGIGSVFYFTLPILTKVGVKAQAH